MPVSTRPKPREVAPHATPIPPAFAAPWGDVGSPRAAAERSTLRAALDVGTAAFSREFLDDFGRNELVRLERFGHACSILFMDVHGMKAVNERLGHSAGDDVLRRFCQVVRASARATDRLGRHAGDDFVLLMPNTPRAAALQAGRRVLAALAEQRGDPPLAASIGVATAREAESWEALLGRGEAQLRVAKARGAGELACDAPPPAQEPLAMPDSAFINLRWRASYDSGDATIDAERRELFGLAGELLRAVANQRAFGELLPLVDRLMHAVETHFLDEERLLRMVRYRGVVEHARAHAQLMDRARRLVADLVVTGRAPAGFFDFLMLELIAGHFLTADRAYFPCLAAALGTAQGANNGEAST